MLLDILLYRTEGMTRWELYCSSEWLGVGVRLSGISEEDFIIGGCEFKRST